MWSLAVSLLIAAQPAGGWWSGGILLERAEDWLQRAARDPGEAATLMGELADHPQGEEVMRFLVRQPGFGAALAGVLRSGRAARQVDTYLARCGRAAMPSLGRLLQANPPEAPATRGRCAMVLGRLGQPEAGPMLLEGLERETEPAVLEVEALALSGCDPPLRGHDARVVALLLRPELPPIARRLVRQVLGDQATVEAVHCLINDAGAADPREQADALLALQIAAVALRRREPQGDAADLLVGQVARPGGFAEQLWQTGEDATLRRATAALLWSNLRPRRFEREMDVRRPSPAFWLAMASDPNVLDAWCLAAAERWEWPAPERRQAVRALLGAGLLPAAAEEARRALAEALGRRFPEWPLIVAAEALASRDPMTRAAGQGVLCAAGDPDAVGAGRSLEDLTWPAASGRATRDALVQAGRFPEVLAWAAEQAIAHQPADTLVPYVTGPAPPAVRDRILTELLALGEPSTLRRVAREGRLDPPARAEVLARLAARGNPADVLFWAREDPASFLDRLLHLARSDRSAVGRSAALLLVRLLQDADLSRAAVAWRGLLSLGELPQPLAEQAWRRCLEHVRRDRPRFLWALRLVAHPPELRNWLAGQDLGKLATEVLPDDPAGRAPMYKNQKKNASSPPYHE